MSVEMVGGPRAATRRRGEVLERAIFEAAVEELRSLGYGRMSMEGVASRARTGKAALYRRWSGKGDLVVDALEHLLPTFGDLPDEGSVRDDVLELLRRMRSAISSPTGCAIRALVSDVDRDEAFVRVVHERVLEPRKQEWVAVLRRAADRGQVDPRTVSPMIAEVGPCLLAQRYLSHGTPVPDSFLVSVVDDVIMPLLHR